MSVIKVLNEGSLVYQKKARKTKTNAHPNLKMLVYQFDLKPVLTACPSKPRLPPAGEDASFP